MPAHSLLGAQDVSLLATFSYPKRNVTNCHSDKILPVVKEWQVRPLENRYAVVFMDAIHFHVRSEGQIIKKSGLYKQPVAFSSYMKRLIISH